MERGPTTRAKIHEESLSDFESLILAQPVPQGVHPLVDGLLVGFNFLGSTLPKTKIDPENRLGRLGTKRKELPSNYSFSGAKMLVSGRVTKG